MSIKGLLLILCSVFIVGCSQPESSEQLFYEALTKSTVEAAMAKTVNKPALIKLTVSSSTPTPDMSSPFIAHVYTKIVKDTLKTKVYNQPTPAITPLPWCCITQEANLKNFIEFPINLMFLFEMLILGLLGLLLPNLIRKLILKVRVKYGRN